MEAVLLDIVIERRNPLHLTEVEHLPDFGTSCLQLIRRIIHQAFVGIEAHNQGAEEVLLLIHGREPRTRRGGVLRLCVHAYAHDACLSRHTEVDHLHTKRTHRVLNI